MYLVSETLGPSCHHHSTQNHLNQVSATLFNNRENTVYMEIRKIKQNSKFLFKQLDCSRTQHGEMILPRKIRCFLLIFNKT